MKTFQKIALVSAIAAAPFAAQADLTPMEDSLMGNTTGQAGVTIEIDLGAAGIGIGSVVYTDTAHNVDGTTLVTDGAGLNPGDAGYVDTYNQVSVDGGTVSLENIKIGLTGVLKQTIDVSENGDLVMGMTMPANTVMNISAGGDSATQVGAYSALKLGGNGESEIVNNLSLDVALGDSTTTIRNLGTAATLGMGELSVAGVTGSYSTMKSSMAIEMSASAKVTNMNVGLFGYTRAQAEAIAAGNPSGATADQIAGGSAIQLSNVSITDANSADGMFSVDQVIWAVGGDASLAGSEAGVYIQMGAMNLDINVAGIGIGGSSIGSLAVNGLELNGMTQRIYGH